MVVSILQGKSRREQSLLDLTTHLKNVYLPCERTWILLFPEGGFLRKRREVARKFALQNNLPILHYVTIPRVGAVQNVVATIGPARAPKDGLTNGNVKTLSRNKILLLNKIIEMEDIDTFLFFDQLPRWMQA